MSVDLATVKRVARLARIAVTEDEAKKKHRICSAS